MALTDPQTAHHSKHRRTSTKHLHSEIRILGSSIIDILPKPKWYYSGVSRIQHMVDVLCSSMR